VSYDVFYYDLGTGQLFADSPGQVPPIDAPSGPGVGVRAYVFSCNDCSDEQQRFIAWYERQIPASKRLQEDPNAAVTADDLIDVLSAPIEISEDGKQWKPLHPILYMQWQINKRQTLCGGGATLECKPQPATSNP